MKVPHRIFAVVMMVVLCLGICPSGKPAKAAGVIETVLEQNGTLQQSPARFTFKNPKDQLIGITLYTDYQADLTVTVTEQKTGKETKTAIAQQQWKYDQDMGVYQAAVSYEERAAGEYSIALECQQPLTYKIFVYSYTDFTMNKKKATIATGQQLQLSTTGKVEKVTWKSSKKKVATVNKKGMVTGKKPGTTKITAKWLGMKVSCVVTVKQNIYQRRQSKLEANGHVVSSYVYQITERKGALVCKVRILNNTPYYIVKFDKLPVKIEDSKGKVVAKQTFQYNSPINTYMAKNITLVIDKKNVKEKFIDLKTVKAYTDGAHFQYQKMY